MLTAMLGIMLCLVQPRTVDARWDKVTAASTWEAVIVAETKWKGNGGSLTAGASWTNSTPDSTHTPAIFDGTLSQNGPTDDMSGLSGQTFQLITLRNFAGNIGDPSNPLEWSNEPTGTRHLIYGSGSVYLSAAGVPAIVVDSSNNTDAMMLVGAVASVYVLSGRAIIGSLAGLGPVAGTFGSGAILDIRQFDNAETLPDYLYIVAGTCNCARTYTGVGTVHYMHVGGGVLNLTGVYGVNIFWRQFGGRINYIPSGTITVLPDLHGAAGLLDLSGMDQAFQLSSSFIGPNYQIIDPLQGGDIGSLVTDMRSFAP